MNVPTSCAKGQSHVWHPTGTSFRVTQLIVQKVPAATDLVKSLGLASGLAQVARLVNQGEIPSTLKICLVVPRNSQPI